ncbi:MAG TPA: hypothetical protein DIS71_07775 [Rhodobacter sp.]|nr:hypothetical protein [Rhodobacter sp.]
MPALGQCRANLGAGPGSHWLRNLGLLPYRLGVSPLRINAWCHITATPNLKKVEFPYLTEAQSCQKSNAITKTNKATYRSVKESRKVRRRSGDTVSAIWEALKRGTQS